MCCSCVAKAKREDNTTESKNYANETASLSSRAVCLAFFLKWYNFTEKTLIVADRGYESYNVFAHFLSIGMWIFLFG